jgi:nitrogen fixation-related uncharacterized protein
LVGAFLIIVGLYCLLWAKKAENLVTGQPENGKGYDDDKKMVEISVNETARNSVTDETK